MKSKWLTSAELARICGVTTRTIRNWCSAKSPLKRSRRSGRHYFDPSPTAQWLVSQGKHQEAARLRGFIDSLKSPKPKTDPRQPVADKIAEFEDTTKSTDQLVDAREAIASTPDDLDMDIFFVRKTTARTYATSLRLFLQADDLLKPQYQKNINATADLMRKLELDCITVGEKRQAVIHMSDAIRTFRDVAARIKQSAMLLPHEAADDLAAMTDPAQIAEYLQRRMTDMLRHLVEGPPALGAPEELPE